MSIPIATRIITPHNKITILIFTKFKILTKICVYPKRSRNKLLKNGQELHYIVQLATDSRVINIWLVRKNFRDRSRNESTAWLMLSTSSLKCILVAFLQVQDSILNNDKIIFFAELYFSHFPSFVSVNFVNDAFLVPQ
jgi:hypothetical protein